MMTRSTVLLRTSASRSNTLVDQPRKITAIAGREGTIGQSNLRIGSLHEAAASIGCNRYASRLPVGPDLVRCSSTGRLTLSDGGVAAASDATSGQAAIRRALAAKKPNYCNASNAGHWRRLIKRYNFYLCEKLFIGAQLEVVSYSVAVS